MNPVRTHGARPEARASTLSREELALAYAAMFVLAAAIAFTVGAIFV